MSTQTNQCDSARKDPTSSNHALTAEPRVTYQSLERIMNIKKLIAAVAVFAVAGSAFRPAIRICRPRCRFKSTLTRAEVRQDLAQAASQGAIAQRQHDGQEAVYAASNRSRQEVRAEAIQSAQSRHAGDVNNLYFGAESKQLAGLRCNSAVLHYKTRPARAGFFYFPLTFTKCMGGMHNRNLLYFGKLAKVTLSPPPSQRMDLSLLFVSGLFFRHFPSDQKKNPRSMRCGFPCLLSSPALRRGFCGRIMQPNGVTVYMPGSIIL